MGKDDLRQAKYVIDIGPLPSLPVVGSDLRFPVGRIFCVGRNYAEHAREMGHDPDREPPFFFMKAPKFDRAGRLDRRLPRGQQGCPSRDRNGGRHRQGWKEHSGRENALDHVGVTESAWT